MSALIEPNTHLIDRENRVIAATYDDGEWPVRVNLELDGEDLDKESLGFLIEHLQGVRERMEEPRWDGGDYEEDVDLTPWVVDLPGVTSMGDVRISRRQAEGDPDAAGTVGTNIVPFPSQKDEEGWDI